MGVSHFNKGLYLFPWIIYVISCFLFPVSYSFTLTHHPINYIIVFGYRLLGIFSCKMSDYYNYYSECSCSSRSDHTVSSRIWICRVYE